jgi:uncharacterized protein (TIRG00374 family)
LKLQGALLGAGNIALRGHVPQWTGDDILRRDAEIVAVADLSAVNREAARVAFPAARLYERAEDLLDQESIAFCDICTPPFTHRVLVEEAAARGLHVVCEKPIAATLRDAEAIAETIRMAGVVFVPCHQYHYSPQWQTVRRLLPRIGRIYLAEYEVQRTEANPGNPHWAPSWRTDRNLAGGGILFDHGAHIFYQLFSVLGEPEAVQAMVRTLRHTAYGVEDSAFVVMDYGDALAHVRLTWAARHREIRYRFVGEEGELQGNDESLTVHAATTETVPFLDGLSKDSSHSEWYSPLLRDFVTRVQQGDTSNDGLEEAVSVSRLIGRAYESSDSGRTLPLQGAVPVAVGRALSAVSPEAPLVGQEALGAAEAEYPPQVQRKRRPWLVRIAALGLMGLATWWAVQDLDFRAIGSALGSAAPGWIVLAAIVNLMAVYAMAGRWLAILVPLSPLVTWAEAFKATLMGFAVSTVVPARAGELARADWLARKTGLPRVSILGSIILDSLVNGLGILCGLACLPLFIEIPAWLRPGAALVVGVFAAAASAVFLLRPRPAGVTSHATPESRGRIGSAVYRAIEHARQGMTAVRSRRALGLSFASSLVAWALEFCVVMCTQQAFDLHVPALATALVLLAVNLALIVPFAPPANLGMIEVGATLALMEFGVPKERALAFALWYHLLQLVPIGIAGLLLGSHSLLRSTPVPHSARP